MYWALLLILLCLKCCGSATEKRPGRMVKGPSRSVYFVDEQNVKHHVPDWTTFISMGYSAADIKAVTEDDLAALASGPPLDVIQNEAASHPRSLCPCGTSRDEEGERQRSGRMAFLPVLCITQREGIEDWAQFSSILHINPVEVSASDERLLRSNCTVLLQFANNTTAEAFAYSASLQCPGLCGPVPHLAVPGSRLRDIESVLPALHPDAPLTCTLTPRLCVSSDGLRQGPRARAAHMLSAMALRRVQECREAQLWPTLHSSNMSRSSAGSSISIGNGSITSNRSSNSSDSKAVHLRRRRVDGLVLWVGADSRRVLGLLQQRAFITALANLSGVNSSSSRAHHSEHAAVVGWLATDTEYPCRTGSTLCEDLINGGDHYYSNMPSTQLHVSAPGWGCAQRRPLRALAHLLLLLDPIYVLLVDDDTYVSAGLLRPHGPLHAYIHSVLAERPWVLGELTLGRKVTRRGFFWGGAGYLIGPAALQLLQSHTLQGPTVMEDSLRTAAQTTGLALLHQAVELAAAHCPGGKDRNTCLLLRHTATAGNQSVETGFGSTLGVSVGAAADLLGGTRVLDLCTNMLSEENTCYHSDHALSRCLVHGAYAGVIHTPCSTVSLPQSASDSLPVGMCFGTDVCEPRVHLTCHRWMPGPDLLVPIAVPHGNESAINQEAKYS